MKKRFSDKQIISILRGAEAGIFLCCKPPISDSRFYTLRKKYGGMKMPEVKHLKSLEEENARLKKLLVVAMLDKEALQAAIGESIDGRSEGEAVVLMCDTTGLSQSRACRLTCLYLSTCSNEAQRPELDVHLFRRTTHHRTGTGAQVFWLPSNLGAAAS